MDDLVAMRRAIAACRAGMAAGQAPFGSVIVRGEEFIAEAHNTIKRDIDPTAHAEINAIRAAARKLGDAKLTGCTLYSTCEPCPMCMGAILWSRIDRLVIGATSGDASASGIGQLNISARFLAQSASSALVIQEDFLRVECRELFEEWTRTRDAADA